MRIRVIMFDIGGVLLTNAWDGTQRAAVLAEFGVDPDEFEARHHASVDDLETGRLSLADYLARLGVRARLKLNTVGDRACRPAYLQELKAYLAMLEGRPVWKGVQAEWIDWRG